MESDDIKGKGTIGMKRWTRLWQAAISLGVLAGLICGRATGQEAAGKKLQIAEVSPTVFYVKDGEHLRQVAEVVIENPRAPAAITIEVTVDDRTMPAIPAEVPTGRKNVPIRVPEGIGGRTVVITLKAGSESLRREVVWPKQRRWEICLVPITHHDLGYTATIEQVMRSYAGFYDEVLRFCDETADWPEESKYRYTIEGGWSLQHFVENRPKKTLDKLAKYVAEGRIEIGALYGNQISCLSGHEEGIRLMYPSFRLQQRLGGRILCGSITDVPGLSWSLPTVLAGAGVKYFFAGCPTYFEWGRNDIHTFWDESAILRHGRPDAFWWKGPDGNKVLVYYQGSYGFFRDVVGPSSYDEVHRELPKTLEGLDKQGCPFDTLRFIHNGLDNHPPDVQISRIVRQWNDRWAYPRLVVATNTLFFERLEKQCRDLRTFSGELPDTDYVVGSTSTAKETAINRTTHDRLVAAENLSTIATLLGHAYPTEAIRDAYDNMMLYDEHTWGKAYPAGPEQDWAWHEKSLYAHRAAGLADTMLNRAAGAIAQEVRRTEDGRHIVVLNPLAIARTDIVRVARFAAPKAFELVDVRTGAKVPYQLASLGGPLLPTPYSAHRYARGSFESHELTDLVFAAEDVPALGCRTYRIVPVEKAMSCESRMSGSGTVAENEFFRVELDVQRGGIRSVLDKKLHRELVDQKAEVRLNQIVVKSVPTAQLAGPSRVQVQSITNGPVFANIVTMATAPGCPQVIQEVILYDKLKRVDLANRVLKDSSPLMEVYFAFPFAVDRPEFCYEGTDSVIKPLKDQFPGSNSNYYAVQHWADVSDGRMGVTLAAIESHLMEFGGLWPCYVSQAHHGLTPPAFGQPFAKAEQMKQGHIYAFVMDSNFRTNFQPVQQGDMLFRYSLTSHEGDWKRGGCRNFGWSFSNPLVAVQVEGKKEGQIEPAAGFCSVDPANVLLMTVKQAEDGEGLILRLIETEGKATRAVITLPQLTVKRCRRTNLVEQDDGDVSFAPHSVSIDVPAFGIQTLRILNR
jgi:alpha-mannosidase